MLLYFRSHFLCLLRARGFPHMLCLPLTKAYKVFATNFQTAKRSKKSIKRAWKIESSKILLPSLLRLSNYCTPNLLNLSVKNKITQPPRCCKQRIYKQPAAGRNCLAISKQLLLMLLALFWSTKNLQKFGWRSWIQVKAVVRNRKDTCFQSVEGVT